MVGGLLIFAMVCMALFASLVVPYDPFEINAGRILQPPSPVHWMGTDDQGRDVLSRVIHGARISLWVGFIAVVLGQGLGAVLGILSGYCGGSVDLAVQRGVDIMMAFPSLILALAIMAVLGTGITPAMMAIGIAIAPGASRVIRGAVLSVKENEYVLAAQAMGGRPLRIMASHILPNVTAPLIVLATVGLGNAILTEAALSFLGLGVQPPAPSWGGMLSGYARTYMQVAPWTPFFPGVAITLAVLGFNLLGDAMRDIWDPRLKA
jgi:ABC-type dipeptide/oligopeptide/nickel transport system permease subunit